MCRLVLLHLTWLTLIVAAVLAGCNAQLGQLTPGAGQSSEDPSLGSETSVDAGDSSRDASTRGGPRLLSTSPLHGDVDVPVDAALVLTFDRPVRAGSGLVRLITEDGMDVAFQVEAADVAVDVAGARVTVDWGIELGYATWYLVEIETGAFEGMDGAAFDGLSGSSLRFQTEMPDAVTLLATFPEADAPLEPTLTMVFNLDVVSSGQGELRLHQLGVSDAPVASVQVSDATRVLVRGPQVDVNLGHKLEYATDYYVVLDPGAIVSTDGASFSGFSEPEVFRFTTVNPPQLVVRQSSPVTVGVPATNVAPNAPFIFTFDAAIVAGDGWFQVYEAESGALVHEVAIDTPGVTIQGSTLSIVLPAELEVATGYYATLGTGSVMGVNGAVFDGLEEPDDLAFVTAGAALPNVVLTGSIPADGDIEVPVETHVELSFDVPVARNLGSISLHDAESGETLVDIDVTSDAVTFEDNTLTLTFTEPLPGSTSIEVRVAAGAVVGTEGGLFPGLSGREVVFRTESSFGLVGLAPLNVDDAEVATNLELTFSEDVAVGQGTITVRDGATVVETITVPSSRVTVGGETISVDLDNILAGGRTFEVRADAGAFVEVGGDGVSRAVSAGEWTFTTAAPTAPAGVASGLVLWLDAAYPASIKGENNVALWADRSGQYRNVTQSVVGNQPKLSVGTFNGRDAVEFDGVDDVLRANGLLNVSNLDGFIVWRSPSGPTNQSQGALLANGSNFEVNRDHPLGVTIAHSLASCIGGNCPSNQWYVAQFLPAPLANQAYVWNFGYSASETSLFARSNAGATLVQTGPSAPPTNAERPLTVGGEPVNCTQNCYFDGEIAEVLLYSTPLTASQRLDVTQYLYEKWVAPSGGCSLGEQRGPAGKCYYYSSVSATWEAARTACRARGPGWELAEVRNELDQRFLTTQVLPNGATVWLGAQDSPGDIWRWASDGAAFWTGKANGAPTPGWFVVWESDQPNDQSPPHCMRTRNVTGAWRWSDGVCSETFASVCQGPVD